MIKNYLTIAVRNILRHVSYASINISGLALGITCALVIFSLVAYHLNFDSFHKDSDRIYRFVTEQHRDHVSYTGSVPPALAKTFEHDFTYAEKIARVCTAYESLISVEQGGDRKKFTADVSFTDPEFFDIFNFPLVSGNRSKILSQPNTGVITRRLAKIYFGTENALDKTLRMNSNIEFTITGIIDDIPDNTDLRSEIYLSFSTVAQYVPWYADEQAWGGITTELMTFAKFHRGVNIADVEKALTEYPKRYRPESKNRHVYKLQPLNDMHFNAQYGGVMERTSLITLSIIGLLLVITACLNFINLATAQAVTRSKEVGVRKVLGSARMQLFWQFALETGVVVAVAGLLAIAIAYSIIPYVNELLNTRVQFHLLNDPRLMIFLPVLLMVVTMLSCFYPGLVLSGFRPVQTLKGKLSSSGNFNLRRSLVTVQFTISQVLLIGLIVVVIQMEYFKNTDMGFDKEAVVMIPVGSNDEKMKTLKTKFTALPDVKSVTVCSTSPSSQSRWNTILTFDNRSEAEAFAVSFRSIDENYINTFGLKLIAGRNLEPSDTVREFLMNETLVEKLGLQPEDVLGKHARINGNWTGPIVGVVKDFHDLSLHSDISPLLLSTVVSKYLDFAVKIDMKNSRETLAALEKTWTETYPELMYNHEFLDEQLVEFYQTEETMLTLIKAFSLIALFIGCMGLYGMASFMSVQKTKEIGIRKVLGGSVSHILWIFGKEFSILIVIAFLIAAPVGWVLMTRWLSNFAYHIPMSGWILVSEIVAISSIVLLTVGYKALRSAVMNPVNALRTE